MPFSTILAPEVSSCVDPVRKEVSAGTTRTDGEENP
jgi:hypothetical protein